MFFFSCSITWAGYIKPAAEEEESSQRQVVKREFRCGHNTTKPMQKNKMITLIIQSNIELQFMRCVYLLAPYDCATTDHLPKPQKTLSYTPRHLFCIVEMLQKTALYQYLVCIRIRCPVSHNLKMLMRKRRYDIEASKLARDDWEIYVTKDICRR